MIMRHTGHLLNQTEAEKENHMYIQIQDLNLVLTHQRQTQFIAKLIQYKFIL